MDRYTAAALGQNLSNAFSDIGQIFDPRARAAADQQRLTVEGLRLRNTGQGIENQYAPGVFGSKILAQQAAANNYNASANKTALETRAGQDLYNTTKLPETAPSNWEASLPDSLKPLSSAFNVYGKQYGVDPRALAAISMHETGGGSSNAYINKRNAMGVSDANGPIAFETPEQSVERMARVLANPNGPYAGKATFGEIANVYAPVGANNDPTGLNGSWGGGVSKFYQQFGGDPKSPIFQSVGVTPSVQDNTRAATLSNLFNGGGAVDLMTGRAKALGMGATDELTARQAALGQGVVFNQGEYFEPSRSDAFQNRDLTSAFNINEADNQSDQVIAAAKIIADGAPGSSSSSGTGSPRNPLDSVEGAKFTNAAMAARFGMADEEGNMTVDPSLRVGAAAWESSVANLTESGVPIQVAIEIADRHHKISDAVTEAGEGWWDGDPRKEIGKNFNPMSISPKEATQIGAQYGTVGGNDQRMAAAAMLDPRIAALYQTTQTPDIANTGAPVTGVENNPVPPMLRRPTEESSRPARASDQFQRREGSAERKARESKAKEIADLESNIKATIETLRSGSRVNIAPYMAGGGLGGAYINPSSVVKLSDDDYNTTRDRLIKMEKDLEKLKGGGVQAGQNSGGAQTIKRYNPATGAIE